MSESYVTPFDDDAEWRAKKLRRQYVQAPTKVAIFLIDHTERVSTTERGRYITDLPVDHEAVASLADSFAIMAGKSPEELASYCQKIATNILPTELLVVYRELQQTAALLDPSRQEVQ